MSVNITKIGTNELGCRVFCLESDGKLLYWTAPPYVYVHASKRLVRVAVQLQKKTESVSVLHDPELSDVIGAIKEQCEFLERNRGLLNIRVPEYWFSKPSIIRKTINPPKRPYARLTFKIPKYLQSKFGQKMFCDNDDGMTTLLEYHQDIVRKVQARHTITTDQALIMYEINPLEQAA